MSLADYLIRTKHPAADLLRRDRPPLTATPEPLVPEVRQNADLLDEYAKLSAQIGVLNPHIDADLRIERFKAFLRSKDWPVFSLAAVVAYMDQKAAEESAAKSGWHWRPLRAKDHVRDARFGVAAREWYAGNGMMGSGTSAGVGSGGSSVVVVLDSSGWPSYGGGQETQKIAASDHYAGPHKETRMGYNPRTGANMPEVTEVPPSAEPYDKLVPIHALRKVAAIEAEFAEPVAFFVCDYAPAPHIEYPDPFLMAVIDNPRLGKGVGRFVIDFWDEPGFGLDAQVSA